jgi:hypothetical protein
MELLLREKYEDLWIVTPRMEIIVGMLEKLELFTSDPEQTGYENRITTPIRMRNRLLRGEGNVPAQLILDEGHHGTADSYQQLDLLCGCAPSIAFTATPYRGTPRGTREFLQFWGEPNWAITYKEAQDQGYIKLPKYEMLPLVDDDVVDISNGEFSVESLEAATMNRLEDLVEHLKTYQTSAGLFDKATMVALPTTALCGRFVQIGAERGVPIVKVTAETPKEQRQVAFRLAVERHAVLCHIDVVSEGVDLPLRRLVDMRPTMSPVRWLQQLGRITRPTDDISEYVCCNRNLFRHAYTLEGVLPTRAVADAERVFGESRRCESRAFGLEAIGRFKPARVKLLSGVSCSVYSLSTATEHAVLEFIVLVHPCMEPIWGQKLNGKNEDGTRNWGSWKRCEAPTELRGFGSVPEREVSPKQKSWWQRSAHSYGIDSSVEPNRKTFQTLPFLKDIGLRLR